MRFESNFLVHILQVAPSDWVCLCPTISLEVFAPTRQKALEAMRVNLEIYANNQGFHYINSIGKGFDNVCCPFGQVNLPIDIWICKKDKQVCKIQAWISLSDKEQFKNGCHAPDEEKQDIYQTAVVKGRYKHHKAGCYLCPTCSGERLYSRYHYPWELTPLSHFVDTDSYDFRATLIKNESELRESLGFNQRKPLELIEEELEQGIMSLVSSNLCPDCLMRVISIVRPDLLDEFESIQFSFTI